MKIIEGMKEIKRLEEKVKDLHQKINKYCLDFDFENPVYPDQKGQVTSWIQGVHDSLKEATRLRIAIQKTNLSTVVPIELGGKRVEHSIAEWIVRRRLYAPMEQASWETMTPRGMNPNAVVGYKTPTGETKEMKMRLYFDPVERDNKVELYRSEPGIIDRTLEVINATTDLLD